jgi:hypothetical protein
MFFIVPAFGLLLANLFFFASNLDKASKTDFRKAILLGTCLACVVIFAMALHGNFYIFSFILQAIIFLSLILLISLILYLKKDMASIKRSLFINTILFSGAIIFMIGLYVTRDLNWFHY